MRNFATQIAATIWGGGDTAVLRSREAICFAPCPSKAFTEGVGSEGAAAVSFEHAQHSSNCSMVKIRDTLGFVPKWGLLDAVADGVRWLEQVGKLDDQAAIQMPTVTSEQRERARYTNQQQSSRL